MVFCLKLVRRRSMAFGLSSGRPCCSARFCSLSFKRWLVQARNTTRSGVQIYQESMKHYSQTCTTQINSFTCDVHNVILRNLRLRAVEPVNHLRLSLIFKFNALRSKCLNCKSHKNKDFTLSKVWRDWISCFFFITGVFIHHLNFTGLNQLQLFHWWCNFNTGEIISQTGWYCTFPTRDENPVTCHTHRFSLF